MKSNIRMLADELVIEGKHIPRELTPIVIEGHESLRLYNCRIDGPIICDGRFAHLTVDSCVISGDLDG